MVSTEARQGDTASRNGILRRMPVPEMAFRTRDGQIGHARCGRILQYLGRRAGIELDFYCESCVEHVTLPDIILGRIPYGEPADGHRRY